MIFNLSVCFHFCKISGKKESGGNQIHFFWNSERTFSLTVRVFVEYKEEKIGEDI